LFNCEDFVKVIKKTSVEAVNASKPADIVFGKVQSTAPLSIFIDQKLVLTEKFIIVPQHLTDYEIEISFEGAWNEKADISWHGTTNDSGSADINFDGGVKHKIKIYNALKNGDSVILLRQHGGQKYIVIDKVVV
jgi:hypothetical protein